MTRFQLVTLHVALACTASGAGSARAGEPWPEPRPLAREVPAFRAPAEPPPDEPASAELPAEPAAPLALADAIALALARSPDLAAFSWEARASEARTVQAGKLPNPELSVRLYQLDNPDTSVDPDEGRVRVMLGQRFELGGKRHRRVVLGDVESDLAGWDYEAKRIEVATAVAARFAEVLGAQRARDARREHVAFLEQLRDQVASLVAKGSLRSLELHEATRQLGMARIELHTAEGLLATARFQLAATWGASAPQFTEATGELWPPAPIPTIETVLGRAQQAPEVARWDAEVARGEAELSLARSERVPDLEAGAGVRWQENGDEPDYLLDFAVDLPLLDRKQGDVLAARHSIARAQAARQSAEALSRAAIAEAYYRLQASAERATRLGGEVLPAVRSIFESHQRGLELGPSNLDDLLDARRDLARSEVEQIEALVDYHVARSDLERLVGQDLDTVH